MLNWGSFQRKNINGEDAIEDFFPDGDVLKYYINDTDEYAAILIRFYDGSFAFYDWKWGEEFDDYWNDDPEAIKDDIVNVARFMENKEALFSFIREEGSNGADWLTGETQLIRFDKQVEFASEQAESLIKKLEKQLQC